MKRKIFTLCVLALLALLTTGCSGDAQLVVDEFTKIVVPLEKQAFVNTTHLESLSRVLICCAGPMAFSCLVLFLTYVTKAVIQRHSVSDILLNGGLRWVFLMVMCAMMIGFIPVLTWLGQELWKWAGMDITLFTHNLDIKNIKSALAVIAEVEVFTAYHLVYQIILVLALPFSIWLAIQIGTPKALIPCATGVMCFLGMGPAIAIGTKLIAATPEFTTALVGSANTGIFLLILAVSVFSAGFPIVFSSSLALLWVIQGWHSREPAPAPTPAPAPPGDNGNSSSNSGRQPWNAANFWTLLSWFFSQQDASDDGTRNPTGHGPLPSTDDHADEDIIYADPPPPRLQLPAPGETIAVEPHGTTLDSTLPATEDELGSLPDPGELDLVDAAALEGLRGTGQLPDPHGEQAALRDALRQGRQAFEDKLQRGEILPDPDAGEPIGAVRALRDVLWDDHGREELILREGEIVWAVDRETVGDQEIATIESPRHSGVSDGVWLGQDVEWVSGLQLPSTETTQPAEATAPTATRYHATHNIYAAGGMPVIARRGQRIWPVTGADGALSLKGVKLSPGDYVSSSRAGGET